MAANGLADDRCPAGSDADAALVERARTDREAFGLLYDRYAERVYRYCYRRLGQREAAEDATAQVFAKALPALASYREGGTFAAWLFAIAHTTTSDALRRRRLSLPLDLANDRPDSEPTPEEAAIAAEERLGVRRLLAHLPPDQRQAMELRLAGLTGVEVAAAMGRTHRAVKMLQFRAIQRLRVELGAELTNPTQRRIADDRRRP